MLFKKFVSLGTAVLCMSVAAVSLGDTCKTGKETDCDFWEDLARSSVNRKVGFVDRQGKVVIKRQFDGVANFSEGLACIRVKGKDGYIDRQGHIVIKPKYEDGGQFIAGLAYVKINGKYGYIDNKGNMKVQPRFEAAGYFFEGLAPVKLNGNYGYIDHQGEIIIEPRFLSATNFSEGLALVYVQGEGNAFIDRKGGIVIPPLGAVAFKERKEKGVRMIGFKDGMIEVYSKEKGWFKLDKTGHQID